MKKKTEIILITVLVCALMLCGCAKTETAEETETSGETETEIDDTAAGSTVFDYGSALDENGFFKDYEARDYVTLPEYKGIAIPDSVTTADPAEVQRQIDYVLEQCATAEQVTDRAVEDGDTVNIDYVGSIDGVEFEGGNTQGYGPEVTIGVTSYIDDFLEQLIGHMPGETFDVNVTFPDSYPQNQDLAGKDAVFVTTINYIAGDSVLPEFDDEFAVSIGYSSADELKKNIEDWVVDQQKTDFADNIIVNAECKDIPEPVLQYIRDSVAAEYKEYAAYYQTDVETMLSANGYASMEDFLAANEESMKNSAHDYFVIQAIAEQEGLSVSEDDVYAQADDEQVENYGMPYMKMYFLRDAVTAFIFDNAAK